MFDSHLTPVPLASIVVAYLSLWLKRDFARGEKRGDEYWLLTNDGTWLASSSTPDIRFECVFAELAGEASVHWCDTLTQCAANAIARHLRKGNRRHARQELLDDLKLWTWDGETERGIPLLPIAAAFDAAWLRAELLAK